MNLPLLPERNITMVLPFPSQRVLQAIEQKTHPAGVTVPAGLRPDRRYWFRGNIAQDAFVLAPAQELFHSYNPIINGKIETTSSGSILFLKYQLFKNTRFFLITWTVLTLFFTLLFSFGIPRMNLALISATLLIVNYLVAFASFQKQVKLAQEKFNLLFEQF